MPDLVNAALKRLFPLVELRLVRGEWIVFKRGKTSGTEYEIMRCGRVRPTLGQILPELRARFAPDRSAIAQIEEETDRPEQEHDARKRRNFREWAKTEGYDRARYAIQREQGYRRLKVVKP